MGPQSSRSKKEKEKKLTWNQIYKRRQHTGGGGRSINDLDRPVLYARSSLSDVRLLLAWQLWGIGTRMEDVSGRAPDRERKGERKCKGSDVPLLEEHGGRQIGEAS